MKTKNATRLFSKPLGKPATSLMDVPITSAKLQNLLTLMKSSLTPDNAQFAEYTPTNA